MEGVCANVTDHRLAPYRPQSAGGVAGFWDKGRIEGVEVSFLCATSVSSVSLL